MRVGVTGPGRATQPEQTGQDGRPANAGPVAEDEITERLGASVGAQPAGSSRVPDGSAGPAPAARSRAWLAVLLVAAFVIGSLTVAAVRHFTRSHGSAAARQEAQIRDQAAAWVAQQVDRDAIVACDRVMCNALTAHGFPSRNLIVLGQTSPDPVIAAMVVETAAVQSLFGTSLATAWAPAILASFGSGTAAITVRVIAPNGAAAYQTELRADLAARKTAGAALLNDPQITMPALAGEQLTAGQADLRLLLALRALAGHLPIRIMRFGSIGPGSSAGVPLRFADLAESDQASHMGSAAYVRSMRSYLNTVDAQYRPARSETVVTGGQAVLRVECTAPSPLAVFGLQGLP